MENKKIQHFFLVSEPSRMLSERSRRQLFLKVVLLAIVNFLVLSSCAKKTFDTKEELMAYVLDVKNGYTQKQSINGIDFAITYKPTDVVVQQMLSKNPTASEIDSLRKKLNEYLYFNLSLSKNNQEILNGLATDRNKFGAMVNQLAFGMSEKVNLFSKTKDTIALVDYIYPRMYGMGGGTTMMLVYPRNEELRKGEYFQFTVEDLGFGTGEVGFKMPTKIINNEPTLRF